MFRMLNLLIALLVLSGCASELVLEEDGALAVIPHRTAGSGHIVVDVTVNGQGPFTFAVDTGASISVIFEEARAEAAIEPVHGKQVTVLGMTGTGTYPVADIARISVGSENWNDARVALLPDTGLMDKRVDGILGLDFLSRYAVWYSQKDRLLRLYPKELVANRTYDGWSAIKLFEMRVPDTDVPVYAFDIFVSGERIPTIFDLGASFNVMNRQAARRLDVRTRSPKNQTDVFGVVGQIPILAEVRVWQLRIENRYWRNRIFLVGEFPVFEVLDVRRNPVAIAGTSFFKQRDFIIDFSRKRLLVRLR
jgi:predicted aspartyl protease